MRERGAERDPLLLATRELTGQCVRAIEQADTLEELACSRLALRARECREPEWQGNELLSRQLTLECAPVVLIGVPEHVAAVPAELAWRRVRNVDVRRRRATPPTAAQDPRARVGMSSSPTRSGRARRRSRPRQPTA